MKHENFRGYQAEVVSRLRSLGNADVKQIGDVSYGTGNYPIFCARVKNHISLPEIAVLGGIHGNEPASVHGPLNFLEKAREYPFNLTVFPSINPAGFEGRTRENGHGTDLNRVFDSMLSMNPEIMQEIRILMNFLRQDKRRYALVISMHDDHTGDPVDGFPVGANPRGFYLYETCSPDKKIGRDIILKLRNDGIPICDLPMIYETENNKGVVWSSGRKDPNFSDDETIEGQMENYTNHVITLETPTCLGIERCISIHVKALSAALESILF